MHNQFGVSDAQLERYKAADVERQHALDDISKTAMANYGFTKGDLVTDKSTGLQYRLDYVNAWIRCGQVQLSVAGKRVWKSGRKAGREAYTSSFLAMPDLEKVEVDA